MVTTIASRNSYSERRFLKRDWQIISYRICTMNCSISPLWLESNGNPMSWIITAASKKRTWILVFSFQSPNFSSKCWSTCRLWHLQNRVHGIWKRYWENNRRNRSSPLWLSANDDVSITSPPITGIFGVISYSYASKAKVGYANAKAVV